MFELVGQYPLELDVPVEATLVDRFFRCYEDLETRWIVFRSYLYCPKKLLYDLGRYTTWCADNGMAAPEFGFGEVHTWVMENYVGEEDPDEEDPDTATS